MTMPPSKDPHDETLSTGPNKSADRTLTVLEHLASAGRRLTLAELAADLAIPKSSLHGLLRTLRMRGWVSTDDTGLRFGLGMRALTVSAGYLAADDLVALSQEPLDELNQALAETVHLGALDGGSVVYLAKRDAPHSLRLVSTVGGRLPAHATAMGKALLAELADEEVRAALPDPLPRLTSTTIINRRTFMRHIQQVREQGYALDDEESSVGIRCVAVAIRTERPARYAMSCSVPLFRIGPARQEEILAAVQGAAAEIAQRWRRTATSRTVSA